MTGLITISVFIDPHTARFALDRYDAFRGDLDRRPAIFNLTESPYLASGFTARHALWKARRELARRARHVREASKPALRATVPADGARLPPRGDE